MADGYQKNNFVSPPFPFHLKLLYRWRWECGLYLLCPKIKLLIITIWADIFANIDIKSLSAFCVCRWAAINLAIYCWANSRKPTGWREKSIPPRKAVKWLQLSVLPYQRAGTQRPRAAHTNTQHFAGLLPDISTGSSSFTVFMEVTSITRCSWCVSSCCRSSIIFAIFVIPNKFIHQYSDDVEVKNWCSFCDFPKITFNCNYIRFLKINFKWTWWQQV